MLFQYKTKLAPTPPSPFSGEGGRGGRFLTGNTVFIFSRCLVMS